LDINNKLCILKKIQTDMLHNTFTDKITPIGGKASTGRAISTLKEIMVDAEKKLEQNTGGKELIYSTVATVIQFGRHLYYESCPSKGCLKKVEPVPGHPDKFACPACGELKNGKQPVTRFKGQVQIGDESDKQWVGYRSDSVGEMILGMSVEELKRISADKDRLDQSLSSRKMLYYYFVVIVRKETYLGEERCKMYIKDAHNMEDPERFFKEMDAVMARKQELMRHFDTLRKRSEPDGGFTDGMQEGKASSKSEGYCFLTLDSPQKILNITKDKMIEITNENSSREKLKIIHQ